MRNSFTLVIPTFNSSQYLEELLNSSLGLTYLNEIIIVDDNSKQSEVDIIEKLITREKYKNLNIRLEKNNANLGGFRNKLKGVKLSSNELIYQVDSDNVITKKTRKFLNSKENLKLINPGELYLPSKINLFKKSKLIENLLFFRKNDVLFTKTNITLNLFDVKRELNSNKSFFKDRTLKSILNIGNPIFLKSDYLKFTKSAVDESVDNLAACSIALSFCYLNNGGKIIFNKNLNHFHRLRDDSAWNVLGDKSKLSDIYFLEKIRNSKTNKKTSKQKIHFITFGTKNFRIAKLHLITLAKESGLFQNVNGFGNSSLNSSFREKYKDILKEPRGAGYWIWKHEIINNSLNELNENDLVVYSDAGSSFNYFAKDKFYSYIDELNFSDYGNFFFECESKHKEIQYTSTNLFKYFNVEKESEIAKSTQLEATHMIFKKNEHTENYLSEYKKLLEADPYLITDKYNNGDNHPEFKDNRHDQSVFSLLTKTLGGCTSKNETHFLEDKDLQFNYPFLAVRKHGHGLKDSIKYLSNYNGIKYKPVYF
tara:strand:- start:4002 stop:5615 length:1614 start_codon:yes stop_codon:yes gene_type:complete